MKRTKPMFLLPLGLALALSVFTATLGSAQPPQGVQINSQVTGTVAGGGTVSFQVGGLGSHILSGTSVLFTAKQLSAATSPLGPITISLNTNNRSTGTLSSTTFPAVHTQNFFLRIKSSNVGTLVSDLPIILRATINQSPPTATYKSISGNVVFYKEGDTSKTPVFTVSGVSSDVKPATTQTVNVSSFVTATVGTSTTTVQFTGSATNLASGQNVLFTGKSLTAVNPGPLGATTATLDTRQSSAGTLGSSTFPTTHTQNFFLQIQSANLGTLVADSPITLTATISGCPPTATYKSINPAVNYYRQGDPTKTTVLTVQGVSSDVTPSSQGKAAARRR